MEIQIRAYRPGDEEAILECWNSIFPAQGEGIPRRDLDWWRWFYLENPFPGEPRIMLAWDGERVVGQYAGCPLRAALEGAGEATVVQGVDLMVRPEYRRVNLPADGDQVTAFTDLVRWKWRARPQRPGLFVYLGRRYYERFCGPDRDLMTYGYAVPAWRMGQKYLGYEPIETVAVLFREVGGPGFAPRPRRTAGVEAAEVERFGADADRLWADLAPALRFAVVRDARYLDWRFAARPRRPYRLFLARAAADGRPRGLAVFRRGDFIVQGAGLVAEWLAAPGDGETTAALLGCLEQAALEAGCPYLAALFPALDPRFLEFQQAGFLVRGTSYVLGAVVFARNPAWFRERWYFTLGDSDLV